MTKTKKEVVDKVVVESEERKEFKKLIEAYKVAFPDKWENGGKKEELLARLELIK